MDQRLPVRETMQPAAIREPVRSQQDFVAALVFAQFAVAGPIVEETTRLPVERRGHGHAAGHQHVLSR